MKRNNIQAINHALELGLKKYQNLVIYGEDVGLVGGVFRATKELQKKFGEKRCFDVPIAEASLVGIAIGMAINGLKPVVEIQFQGFIYPALQQLFAHAARYRNRTRGRFTCPLVLRAPWGTWGGALEHHSEAIEVLFAHIPGLKVVAPVKPSDTKGLLLAALEDNNPVIFLEPLGAYYNECVNGNHVYLVREEVSDDYYLIPFGKAKIIKEWKVEAKPQLTLVTYGTKVYDCEKVIDLLANKYRIELIDLRTIKPWDEETVLASVKKTGRIIVVHEAVRSFSVSAEIIATVSENCLDYLLAPPARVTGYDITVPLAKGEKWFRVTPEKIMAKVEEIINYKY